MNETKKISRRKYTAEFKAKVALEAMQEIQTLPELCSKYQLSPNQINQWKKQLKERSSEVFKAETNGRDDKDKLIEQLYKTIGELTMSVEFLKKSSSMSLEQRCGMVFKKEKLSIRQQSVLLGLCRATFYYTPSKESDENLEIMKLLDSQYLEMPFYGYRRLMAWLKAKGHDVSANRLRRLMDMVCWRTLDDIYIERLWRSVKQEYVYKNPCDTCKELWNGMTAYFDFYNNRRLH